MLEDDIGQRLVDEGFGTVGTDIFLSNEPETPDNCVIVNEYPGRQSLRASASNPGEALAERPRFQIVVRNISKATARTTLNNIFKKLDHYSGTLNSVVYHYIYALDTARLMKRDKSTTSSLTMRSYVSQNYQVVKDVT